MKKKTQPLLSEYKKANNFSTIVYCISVVFYCDHLPVDHRQRYNIHLTAKSLMNASVEIYANCPVAVAFYNKLRQMI